MLKNEYPQFELHACTELYSKMDDVALMALNRGITIRGKDRTSLQALCKGQGRHLKKPEHVRVGDCFNSTKGSLSNTALKYCQLDVEIPLILHSLYFNLPDLTKRVPPGHQLQLGCIVDIMPQSASATKPIARGKICQIGGIWSRNNEATKPEVTEYLEDDFDHNSDVESENEEDLIDHNNVIPPQAYTLFEDEIEADSSDDDDDI
mmetsp:Transcript_47552/g.57242  ORF Transcript_47552/g.57242 Transcript_47552/m.57242 type:complete len:206 (-) Transcript_47552:499-1116(-)